MALWSLLLILFPGTVRAVESQRLQISNLSLFSSEQVFKAPFNHASFYFTLQPFSQADKHCFLDLVYTHSDILDYEASNITVHINGIPVGSRHFSNEDKENGSWRVDLPIHNFVHGINRIEIATKQSTNGSRCQDIDNEGNWVVLSPRSNLHLELLTGPTSLSTYPYPFLDPISVQPIQSIWYLPNNTTVSNIEAMLETASDWGVKQRYRSLKFQVKVGKVNADGGNKILFGQLKEWPGMENTDLPSEVGILSFKQYDQEGDGDTLLISGTDPVGLFKATSTLSSPETVQQIKGNSLFVQDTLAPTLPRNNSVGLAGAYTLSDLGYSDIALTGIFHQDTSIVFNRPLNWRPGDASYIDVHFRHSAQLDPTKSALTVYINEIPVKNTPLDTNNIDHGILHVKIPESELNKSFWTIRFAFMNYIDVDGCQNRYDEVAWSVLNKETEIYLAPGEYNSSWELREFPILSNPGESTIKATMWLSESPDSEELTLATIIAARAAQKGQIIDWNVVMGSETDQLADKGPVVMLVYKHEKERLDALRGYLPAWPDHDGGYEVAPFVSFIPDENNIAALIEVSSSPWNKQQAVYVVLGTNTDSLGKVSEVLSNSTIAEKLSGQLSIISNDGSITSLTSSRDALIGKPGIIKRKPVLGYVMIVGVVLLLMIGSLWIIRKRDRGSKG